MNSTGNTMKKLLILSSALTLSGLSLAQEVGRVVSSTPIVQQVGQPRNACTTEQVSVQQPKSGAGALMGGIAGGALGNAVGGGGGKAAATMIGIMGGAILGDTIEGQPMAQTQNVQRCSLQTFYENRTVAYDVVYEFAGKQYSVQMPNDPGPSVQLQISPVGASAQGASPQAATTYQQSVYSQPTTIVVTQESYPTYPVYERRPYYRPISLNFGYGYWGGGYGGYGGHRGHRR
jgi:uncharacterized protein YcfJ